MTEERAPYGRQRVIGVIQARTGSRRLPAKALRPICGRAMILRIYDRLRLCHRLDAVVAAIPDTPENDRLADVLRRESVPHVRGPEEHLATRLLLAAEYFKADAIVRITGDCALIDPLVVDCLIANSTPGRYASTVYPARSWPDGQDAEVISTALLRRLADESAAEPSPSEWLWQHPAEIWGAFNLVRPGPSLAHVRWVVDTAEDLAGAQVVFSRLPEGFTAEEALVEFGTTGLPEIGKLWP